MTVVDLNSLFESLESGLLLVTGNNRLARVLSGQYNQWRHELPRPIRQGQH